MAAGKYAIFRTFIRPFIRVRTNRSWAVWLTRVVYIGCMRRSNGGLAWRFHVPIVLIWCGFGLAVASAPGTADAQSVREFREAGGKDRGVYNYIRVWCGPEQRQRIDAKRVGLYRACEGSVMGSHMSSISSAYRSVQTVASNASNAACYRFLKNHSRKRGSYSFISHPHYTYRDPGRRQFQWVGATTGGHSCRAYNGGRGFRCFANWRATCSRVSYERQGDCRVGYRRNASGRCVSGNSRSQPCRAGYYKNSYGHCVVGSSRQQPCRAGFYKDSYGNCVAGRGRNQCRAGYYKNSYGHCVSGNSRQQPCRAGLYKDSYGNCVAGRSRNQCRAGYYKNSYGHCVPGRSRSQPCRAGYRRNNYGHCVRDMARRTRCRNGYYRNSYGHCVPGRSRSQPCRAGYRRNNYGHCVRNRRSGNNAVQRRCGSGYRWSSGRCVRTSNRVRRGSRARKTGLTVSQQVICPPPLVKTASGRQCVPRGSRSARKSTHNARKNSYNRRNKTVRPRTTTVRRNRTYKRRCRRVCSPQQKCTRRRVCRTQNKCTNRRVCRNQRQCRNFGRKRKCKNVRRCRNKRTCRPRSVCKPRRQCRTVNRCRQVCR